MMRAYPVAFCPLRRLWSPFRADLGTSREERTMVEEMAVDSVRRDRRWDDYPALCEDQANRAALCWDEDRRVEA
jgi:hypothetical protein